MARLEIKDRAILLDGKEVGALCTKIELLPAGVDGSLKAVVHLVAIDPELSTDDVAVYVCCANCNAELRRPPLGG